ncbi:MAG: pilus assembly protein PilM [Pirellulaceae bacterium]
MKNNTGVGACANCGTGNPESSKFCSGCGKSLFEPCKKCNNPLRIGTAFCGNCGFNAQQAFVSLREELKQTLRRAMELGKSHQYEDAIYLAESVSNPPDFRFQDLADKAKELHEKLLQRRDKHVEQTTKVVESVRIASQAGKLEEVIKLIGSVPQALLPEDVRLMGERAKQMLGQTHQLSLQVRQCVEKRDYMSAGGLLDRLLQLEPDNPNFKRVALQVGNELMKSALKHYESGKHAATNKELASVPLVARNEDYRKLRAATDEVFWLRNHLGQSPFATPELVMLSKKLLKLTPTDQDAIKMHEQLLQRVEATPANQRGMYARWQQDAPEFYRCEADRLSRLQSVDTSALPVFNEHPYRFAVAIGLALQGVGKAKYDLRFAGKQEESKFKKLLSRKKESGATAWGLDIGPSAIRLVRMQLDSPDAKPVITDAELLPFESPLCRPGAEMTGSVAIREKLDDLIKRYPLTEEPVWVASPGRQALGRFLEMPPTDDKQLKKLIESEAEHQFPVPPDQLVWRHWTALPTSDGVAPRYTAIIGVRDFVVQQQMQLMREVNIEPIGMQVEPLALANLISYEFADTLRTEEFTITPPAVAMLDVGVETSIIVVCTQNAFSYRTFDMGGDLWSSTIARETKVTMNQADEKKRRLVEHSLVAPLYTALEEPFGRYNLRLKQLFTACKRDLGEVVMKGLWCTGGGGQIHGFMDSIFSDEQ